jgi:hypothetical protein
MTDPANAELAAGAWLRGITGLTPAMVATALPDDPKEWKGSGFVVVGPDAGGLPNGYVPWHESVLQLECRAVRPNTLTPDWGVANTLAQHVINAAHANEQLGVTLPTRPGYAPVRITSTAPASTARRVRTDPSSYALYRLDLALNWVQVDQPEGAS